MVTRRRRLDAELVRRGLARSREQAAQLMHAGRVQVRGIAAPSRPPRSSGDTPVRVTDPDDPGYVSRGGTSSPAPWTTFPRSRSQGRPVPGRRRVHRRLHRRAAARAAPREVVAVDVGYGQLAWSLRTDERVRVSTAPTSASLTPDAIGGPVELIVADLSFISLPLVLPALTACTADDGDLLPMVKPQFEVGRERLGAGGVVRDPAHRADAVAGVAAAAARAGLAVAGVAGSPLPGPGRATWSSSCGCAATAGAVDELAGSSRHRAGRSDERRRTRRWILAGGARKDGPG